MKFHNKALSLALFFLTSFARNSQHFASAVVPGDGQHNHSCEDQDWDTYVVGFKDRASHDAFLATGVQTAGLGVAELNAVVLQFDSEEEAKAWGAGKHDVEYVEKNGPVCATQTSSSAEQTPYGIDMVKSLQIPDYVANSGIKMCIIDSGYQRHEDLPNDQNGDPVTGKSGLCGSPCNWYDPISAHGNHVAGTIAAIGGNSKGVIGVVKNKKMPLHIVRVFENGSGTWDALANSLLNCDEVGAHIASMSLGASGGTSPPTIIQNAVNTILNRNNKFLMIAAAGNGGNTLYSWPASMPEMMSVASVTSTKARSGFSQYNDQVDIAAPGSGVLSTVLNNGYEYHSGTSMATPHVAGVAAKIWSHAPSMTAQEVRDILEATAEDRGEIGRDDYYGHGIVDAKAAFDALGPPPPTTSPAPTSMPSPSPTKAPTVPTPSPTNPIYITEPVENPESVWPSMKWRILGPRLGIWDMVQLEFWENKDCTGTRFDTGTPVSSGHYPAEWHKPEMAFDDNPFTRWGGRPDSNGNCWIGMEFSNDKEVKCVRYVEHTDHFAPNVIVQTWHEVKGWQDAIIPIDVVPGGTKSLVLPYPLITTPPPSVAPSCEDSPLKVLTGQLPKSARTCKWIREKEKTLCDRPKFASHCPASCGKCAQYGSVDSTGQFLYKKVKRDCAWVKQQACDKFVFFSKLITQTEAIMKTCRGTAARFNFNDE